MASFHPYLETYAESSRDSQDTDEAPHNVDSTFENLDANEKAIYLSLNHAYVSISHNGKVFIPRQKLQEICNEQAVAKELASAFPENDTDTNERLALSICYGRAEDPSTAPRPCRKIFAILALIHQTRLIESFLDHPFCDNDLPLSVGPEFFTLCAPELKPMRHMKLPEEPDHVRATATRDLFLNRQWSVLAPSFEADTTGKGCKVYEFDENDILPIKAYPRYDYDSGCGLDQKVKIHREHNGLGHKYFRLRTISSYVFIQRKIRFQQNLDAYQHATGHIIEICAAFKKQDKIQDNYSFLFAWPEGGSLNDLWAKDPGNVATAAGVQWPEFSRWICTQCHGIIKTIRAIRKQSATLTANEDEHFYRIEIDLRPHSILHFIKDGPPLGILKVSDIRPMRFPRHSSWPRRSFTAYQPYEAPKPDVRPWDVEIWAAGCLFAEFLTWAIRGSNGVEVFETKRKDDNRALSDKSSTSLKEENFYIMRSSWISSEKPKLKSSIKKWFAELTDDLGPGMKNTFFPQFLRFIQTSMLDPNRKRRADCEKVESFLGELLQKNPPKSPYWHFKGTTQYRKDKDGNPTE